MNVLNDDPGALILIISLQALVIALLLVHYLPNLKSSMFSKPSPQNGYQPITNKNNDSTNNPQPPKEEEYGL